MEVLRDVAQAWREKKSTYKLLMENLKGILDLGMDGWTVLNGSYLYEGLEWIHLAQDAKQ
jgi:hypothetical protein